jgi:hypothetical protein
LVSISRQKEQVGQTWLEVERANGMGFFALGRFNRDDVARRRLTFQRSFDLDAGFEGSRSTEHLLKLIAGAVRLGLLHRGDHDVRMGIDIPG